jgi:hypothetical protein
MGFPNLWDLPDNEVANQMLLFRHKAQACGCAPRVLSDLALPDQVWDWQQDTGYTQ